MASWDTLKEYITETYNVRQDIGRGVQLVFSFDDGRSQAVYITRYALRDGMEEWVTIESPIGTAGEINLGESVREAGNLVCGGIALSTDFGDPMVTLRHSVPLAHLDLPEFERPLRMVVSAADTIEARLTGADVN